ncbi:hypothetical protein BJV78DRAFT_201296 [Lactifluus subvellereus]|nr:hypothetical protein BJV78DRAFT_201296 [Lactifluus subvellereus]
MSVAKPAKMELTGSYYHNNVSTISTFNPNSSGSDIPLQPYDPERDPGSEDSMHQQWDEMGHAIGYAPDPRLHAPHPRPSFRPSALYASPADAAAVTLSRDWEDELPNTPTPKTTQPPDVASIPVRGPLNPPSGVNLPATYAHAPPLTTSSFSPPPQSPGSLSSATASQYVTYQPESIAVSPASAIAGTGAAQQQYHQSAAGAGPMEPRTLSPPPTYP